MDTTTTTKINVFRVFVLTPLLLISNLNNEISYTHGANILAVFPHVWKSNYIFGHRIISELIKTGNHKVTLIGAYTSTSLPGISLEDENGRLYCNRKNNAGYTTANGKDKDTISALAEGSTDHNEQSISYNCDKTNKGINDAGGKGTSTFGNLTEIRIDGIVKNWLEMGLSFQYEDIREQSIMERITRMNYAGASTADLILSSEPIQDLLNNSSQKFDLLLVDLFLSDALLGLANFYKMPTLVLSPTGTNKWLNEISGNPNNPALHPNSFSRFLEDMDITERTLNTLLTIFEKFTYSFFHMLYQQSIYEKHFQYFTKTPEETLPPLRTLIHDVSLVLLNSHPVVHYPRAFVPSMIEIGGAHIKSELQDIDTELLHHIESAQEGAIYINFGANLQISDLPRDKIESLLKACKIFEGTYSIIMKWENGTLLDKPKNLLIRDWFYQQEILAHKNVKLFISTGGLLSVMEAIKYRTPILGIPILPEQEVNIKRSERLGIGSKLNYEDLNSENLLLHIQKILYDQKFMQNLENTAKLFEKNFGGNSLQKAVYYIEHILETDADGNQYYLKGNRNNLGFLQIEIIDVLLIILMGLITIIAVPSIIICIILRKSNTMRPLIIRGISKDYGDFIRFKREKKIK